MLFLLLLLNILTAQANPTPDGRNVYDMGRGGGGYGGHPGHPGASPHTPGGYDPDYLRGRVPQLPPSAPAPSHTPCTDVECHCPEYQLRPVYSVRIPTPDSVFPKYRFNFKGTTTEEIYRRLEGASTTRGTAEDRAKYHGLLVLQIADEAFLKQQIQIAQYFIQLAREFLDIALGLNPATGMAQSAYELVMSQSLLTGRQLTDSDRALAYINLCTLGVTRPTSFIRSSMKAVYRGASQTLVRFRRAPNQTELIPHYFNPDRLVPIFQEGERIRRRALELTHRHRITDIVTAAEANAPFISQGFRPPYQEGGFVVKFITTHDTRFVRVSSEPHHVGKWVVKRGEIRGLNPAEIQVKLNIDRLPTHISDVRVPAQTSMSRGMTHPNQWDNVPAVGGNVQYRIDAPINPEWFSPPRPL